MSAGLPGLGLGGLFFVLSALLAPAFEAVRCMRGSSSPARRRQVARQFTMALAMIVAVDLTLRAVLLIASLLGVGSASAAEGFLVLPLTPRGITGGLLAALLLAAKLADLVLGGRRRSAARRGRRIRLRPLPAGRGSGS